MERNAMKDNIWFPSIVWNCDIDVDNKILEEYIYKKVDQEKKHPTLGKPKRPWDSVNLLIEENKEVERLVSIINEKMEIICKDVEITPVQLYDIWANVNPPGVSNVLHDHKGTTFSGVYYVKSLKEQGDLIFERHDGADLAISDMQIIKQNPFNSRIIKYKSRTNNLYIFPSWLKHRVEENKTKENRLSISFNYGV